MQSFPSWVPNEVDIFYKDLPRREDDPLDVDILLQAIQSEKMERAWKAISRRTATARPSRFAQAILTVSFLARGISKYPTTDQIRTHYELAKKVRKLQKELSLKAADTVRQDWEDFRCQLMRHFFRVPPLEALEEFADFFDLVARDMEETKTELTAYVGKPGAMDAKRTYVIRMLSEEIRRLYDQPLHEVVALTSAEILGEKVDPGLVRKLVKTHENLDPPYWAG